jgi:hypothetical protein
MGSSSYLYFGDESAEAPPSLDGEAAIGSAQDEAEAQATKLVIASASEAIQPCSEGRIASSLLLARLLCRKRTT